MKKTFILALSLFLVILSFKAVMAEDEILIVEPATQDMPFSAPTLLALQNESLPPEILPESPTSPDLGLSLIDALNNGEVQSDQEIIEVASFISNSNPEIIDIDDLPDLEVDSGQENLLPVIEAPAFVSSTVGSMFEFSVVISDPDGDFISIKTNLPEGAVYSTTTNLVSWLPVYPGNFIASFSASDSFSTSSLDIGIEIIEPENKAAYNLCADLNRDGVLDRNDPKVLMDYIFNGGRLESNIDYDLDDSGVVDISDVVALLFYIYRPEASYLPSCPIPPDNNNPPPVNPPPPGGGALILVPGRSNPAEPSTSSTAGIANLPPEFLNFYPATSTPADWLYIYDAEAFDPDGDRLTYSLSNAPSGMKIVSSTGFIFWIPGLVQISPDPYEVVVNLSDGINLVSQNFSLLVTASLWNVAAPVVANTPPEPVEEISPSMPEPLVESVETKIQTPTTSITLGPNDNLNRGLLAALIDVFGNLGDWLLKRPVFLFLILLMVILYFVLAAIRKEKPKLIPENSPPTPLMISPDLPGDNSSSPTPAEPSTYYY